VRVAGGAYAKLVAERGMVIEVTDNRGSVRFLQRPEALEKSGVGMRGWCGHGSRSSEVIAAARRAVPHGPDVTKIDRSDAKATRIIGTMNDTSPSVVPV
jgi:hypothetical protein